MTAGVSASTVLLCSADLRVRRRRDLAGVSTVSAASWTGGASTAATAVSAATGAATGSPPPPRVRRRRRGVRPPAVSSVTGAVVAS
ncbi:MULTISPECIES: hypothetical protein, partial [unclassified Streptomyces]|uniref:hypothetical protein n=1 Tax=unclassified Streptomyces TaxID=2593676 RepID=UPI0013841CE3